MEKKLFLGSKSRSRQELLKQARIPFQIVEQDADETVCDWNLSFNEIVQSIALYKMEHVVLPSGADCAICFVLTADTMTCGTDGSMNGKPVDRDDAIKKIKNAKDGAVTGTAFCLDKKIWRDNVWHTEQRIRRYAEGSCLFDVPDEWLEIYLAQPFVYSSAGALFVEGFGAQFVKEIHGSYTAIIGLPMFELREALIEIGFFDF